MRCTLLYYNCYVVSKSDTDLSQLISIWYRYEHWLDPYHTPSRTPTIFPLLYLEKTMFSNFSRVVVVFTNPTGYIRGDFNTFNNTEYILLYKHQIEVCIIKFAFNFKFSFIFVNCFTHKLNELWRIIRKYT